jgi:hypothetical protein
MWTRPTYLIQVPKHVSCFAVVNLRALGSFKEDSMKRRLLPLSALCLLLCVRALAQAPQGEGHGPRLIIVRAMADGTSNALKIYGENFVDSNGKRIPSAFADFD